MIDEKRRILQQRFGDRTEISYHYTEGKNRREVTGRDGKKTVFLYDSRGRILASQDENGKEKEDTFSFERKPEAFRPEEIPGIVRDEKGTS